MASITERKKHRSSGVGLTKIDRGRSPIKMSSYCRWKHAPDRVLALLLLIPAIPLVSLLVVLVRLTSKGPGIYRQVRVGRNGKTFTMYKIRTMRHDAEARTGPTWATNDDPRLTRLGRFIRAVHLDELPQLLNVIKGDMDLVGPRPERPEFTHFLAQEIDEYVARLVVRPGVTGLAQVNLPPDSDLNSVRRKLVLDLEYVRQASLTLDLRILCWTALRLCGMKKMSMRVLRLYRVVILPEDVAQGSGSPHAPIERAVATDTVAVACNADGRLGNGNTPHLPQQTKPR